jgi:DNA-binding transcriptional MerR regulator
VLYRLAIVQRARRLGFMLDEIRQVFFGFHNLAPGSERWRNLSQRKLAELDVLMDRIKTVQGFVKRMMRHCHCDTLDQCGKGHVQEQLCEASLAQT